MPLTLSDRPLETFLAEVPLWQGLAETELQAIARIAIAKTYPRRAAIFDEGDEARGLFVVVQGQVKVYKVSLEGKEQILGIFGAGEHFAEVPAFDGQRYPASATALEPTEVLFFSRSALLDLLRQNPDLAMNLLAVFARRLRQFARLIDDLSLKEVPGRLAAYLLHLSDRTGQDRTGQDRADRTPVVTLSITKRQLAALLGTIPETLSRVLGKLQREGLLALEGSTVRLLDRDRLEALAGSSYPEESP